MDFATLLTTRCVRPPPFLTLVSAKRGGAMRPCLDSFETLLCQQVSANE
jgi:hypothetical protein